MQSNGQKSIIYQSRKDFPFNEMRLLNCNVLNPSPRSHPSQVGDQNQVKNMGVFFQFRWPLIQTFLHYLNAGRSCLTCVLSNRHPFSIMAFSPILLNRKQKRCIFGQKSKFEKKKFSATMFRYFWTPMLTKSKSVLPSYN